MLLNRWVFSSALLTRENLSLQKHKIDGIKDFFLYFTSEDGNHQYLLQAVIGNQYSCSKTVEPNISLITIVSNKQISFRETAKRTVIDLFERYYEGDRTHAITLMRVIKD